MAKYIVRGRKHYGTVDDVVDRIEALEAENAMLRARKGRVRVSRPSDEELEAMAERLDKGERRMDRMPAHNNAAEAALRKDAAAMLRACRAVVGVRDLHTGPSMTARTPERTEP